MAMDPNQVKRVTDNIETTYQALRKAASNIAGLLAAGRATCAEIKAYNLWALATYNAQRGMLTSLRAAGEKDVPALPAAPTLFTWKGITGQDAWKIDCGKPVNGLHGAMKAALRGPDSSSVFLSANQIEIQTQDPQVFNPDAAPTLSELAQRSMNGELGAVPLFWIIIAAVTLGVGLYVGIPALAAYLEEAKIQEETTNRMKTSAAAFATYTSARMQCLSDCSSRGGDTTQCVAQCDKLIPKPDLTVDSARKPLGLGFWATVGMVTVAVGGGALAYRTYKRRRERPAIPA